MKFLTVELIKKHSRIDYDCEDEVLELYGDSAEDAIFQLCRRSFGNFVKVWGGVPRAVVHAALMLVDWSYQQRSPVSSQNLSAVPYTFDLMLKPYMKLDGAFAYDPYPDGQLFDCDWLALCDCDGVALCEAA